MSSLNVDPAALRGTQPSFTTVADTITTGVQALAAVIAAEGECWGNDEIGQAFAKNYTPGVESGQKAVTGLATAMTQTGQNMVTIADALQNQDTTGAGGINAAASTL
ncbi:WXG100 family type VII secretion target [Nocardia sp. NPDC060259]|uniref:WXG100 family type VII secretion target n=1 Tax=Nocardia sp. NPDC060259 TaxID=3347088 RepID=UPI0036675F29